MAPLAAAEPGCVKHDEPSGIPVEHYLLTDAQDELTLSRLPPSAANRTTWSTTLTTTGDMVERTVKLGLGLPDFVVNEDAGLRSKLRVSPVWVEDEDPVDPFFHDRGWPSYSLRLVEGERSVSFQEQRGYHYSNNYYCEYCWDGVSYRASFPGHDPQQPHTHGDGGSTDRPLYGSDVHIELVFRVDPGWMTSELFASTWRFDVHIDGSSFLRAYATEMLPMPEPSTTPSGTGEASDPAAENNSESSGEGETGEEGSATVAAPLTAPQEATIDLGRATPASATGTSVPWTTGLGVLGGLLLVLCGAGTILWRRRQA